MDDFDLDDDFDDIDDIANVDDTDWSVKLTETCHQCGRKYPGSDRNGGHCMTCHLNFASQTGFDKHRIGGFGNNATGKPNTRRCLTPEELTAKGWTVDESHVVRMPPPTHWNTAREDTEQ